MRFRHTCQQGCSMDILLLKTLLKVAALGSISKAAAVLCVTQSAVSRRIRQLEDHVGKPLLVRSGTAVTPTEEGRFVLAKARQIVDLESQIFDTLRVNEPKQRISLCCTPSFGIGRLPSILAAFMADNGESANLSFVFTMPEEALQGIESGRFDLTLIEHCDELDLTGHRSYPLPDDEMVFISAPALGIESPAPSIDQLLPYRLYLKNQQGCARRFLDRNLALNGHSLAEFSAIVYFDDLQVIIREVLDGNGITFASTGLVANELRSHSLRAHRIDGFNHFRPRTLVLGRLEPSPLLLAFIRTIYIAFGMPVPSAWTRGSN